MERFTYRAPTLTESATLPRANMQGALMVEYQGRVLGAIWQYKYGWYAGALFLKYESRYKASLALLAAEKGATK